MFSWGNVYSEEDVTDVFSAVLASDPQIVSDSLFKQFNASPRKQDGLMSECGRVASSRVNSIFKLIGLMQPNYEQSGQNPIVPWNKNSLETIKGKSWPDVLGMRIVLPKRASEEQKASLMENLLSTMTCIS